MPTAFRPEPSFSMAPGLKLDSPQAMATNDFTTSGCVRRWALFAIMVAASSAQSTTLNALIVQR